MRKFTINDSRKAEFSQVVACFNGRLDRSKVNDVELTGNEITVAPSPKSTEPAAAAPAPGAKPAARPAANPNNDAEVAELRAELQAVKERLRREIDEEKRR
ncbi:hypothetical protein RZS08_67300, partial [Arthrospira platensis SPKY1]|nr:hypothetical protein [Arthrospira platensis SPKY1]